MQGRQVQMLSQKGVPVVAVSINDGAKLDFTAGERSTYDLCEDSLKEYLHDFLLFWKYGLNDLCLLADSHPDLLKQGIQSGLPIRCGFIRAIYVSPSICRVT